MTIPAARFIFALALLPLGQPFGAAAPRIAQGQPATFPPPTTAPADRNAMASICVAVLEPEVLGDLPAEQRKAAVDSLDTMLTESLGQAAPGRKEFTPVDRQTLGKVLAEKTAGAAGLTKIAAADVADPLRPFWSAGVIVSPTIRIDPDPTGKSQTARAAVIVEAVLAQTGQVVAECVARGEWKAGQGAPMLKAAALEEFWSRIRRNLAQGAGRPLVEVSPSQLTSSLTRLAWMRDDLDDYLRTHIAAKGSVNLLVPRHPLFTKEERLLRIMGLSAVKQGDPSAGLMVAPDGRVAAELIERVAERVAFGKTPITIRLTWRHGGKSVVSEPINGTVDGYEALRATAVKWLDEQLASLAPQRTDVERDESACKRLAAEELATVGQMLGPDVVIGLGFFHTEAAPAENALGARAFLHAARAAHLDPTNRQAARLVTVLVHCPYYRPGQERWSLTAYERAIAECQRYIDRFKVTVIEDEKVYYRLMWAAEGAAELEAGSYERLSNLTLTPMESVHRHTRACASAAMEVGMSWTAKSQLTPDMRLANLWAGSARVRDWSMLNCPLDELDGELAYWRKFWTDRVEKVPGDVPPWEVVLVGYHTRKHDWASLRQAYSDLAAKCPIRNGRAWTQAKVDVHLKVAGDPDWQTWQPQFAKDGPQPYRLDVQQCDAFFRRLIPQPSQDADFPYPYNCRRLFFPGDVIGPGYMKGRDCSWVEALAITDGEIWFVTPARTGAPIPGGSRLLVCPLADITPAEVGKDIRPKPRQIAWPARPGPSTGPDGAGPPTVKCCAVAHSRAGTTLWVGTLGCGLARLDRVDGAWQGRWYRGQEGMPVDNVFWIVPCRYHGKDQLLMCGSSAAYPPRGPVVWTLDPDGGELKILHENLKDPASDRLALAWPDGRKLPISVYDARLFPKLDVEDAKVVTMTSAGRIVAVPPVNPDGEARLWQMDSADGGELDGRTLAPLSRATTQPGAAGSRVDCLFVENPPGGVNVRMMTRSIAYFGLPTKPGQPGNPFAMPCRGVCQDGVLWLTDRQGVQLWGYVPAPSGAADPDWADHDKWIGPYVPNGGGLFLSLLGQPGPDGRLVATTTEFVDCLDAAELIKTAERAKRVLSTSQMKRKIQSVAQAPGWQGQVGRAVLEKRFDDALAVIDEQLAALGEVNEDFLKKSPAGRQTLWTDLMLWQGLVQARAGFLDEASDLYRKVAESSMSDGPAKVMARLNRIATLYRARRWQDVLDEAEAFSRQFPDLKAAPGPGTPIDPLPRQLADAVRKRDQAATKPDIQPVDTHAPRRIARVKPANATTRPANGDGSASIGLRIIADYQAHPDHASAYASARIAGKDVVPGLAQGLKSSDASTRLAAATLLRVLATGGVELYHATAGAISDLVAAAQDDPAVREQAFVAAYTFGPDAQAMGPLMVRALRDKNEPSRLRNMAGDMIARVSPDEPGLVDVLVGNLKDPDGSVRVSSIHALYQLGKQAVAARPAVIESLKDPVPAVRTAAIGAVRVLGVGADEETRRLITPLLKDPDATARMAAISALHTLGMTPDEEVALLVLLLKDKQLDSNARQRVLSNLAALGPAGKAALPALVEAMKADPVLDVQAAAIRAIGHMGKAALPVIADLKALKQQPGTHPWLQETADSAIKAIERSEE